MKNQEVFERYEKKYLIEKLRFDLLIHDIKEHIIPDRYRESDICSIYFDTPDFRLIRDCLEKPVYREKLRVRSYGVPNELDEVFVELKKKCRGISYKRRLNLPCKTAELELCAQGRLRDNTQKAKEINYVLEFYKTLMPAMYLAYHRVAYCGKAEPNLRITCDSSLIWRTTDLSLRRGVYGMNLIEPNMMVLEIKTTGAFPLWLTRALDELRIYPSGFSKYGTACKAAWEQSISKGSERYA